MSDPSADAPFTSDPKNPYAGDAFDNPQTLADEFSGADVGDRPQQGGEGEAMQRMSLFEFFSKLTFNPGRFFAENYRRRQTPYFWLTFVLFALYCGIDRLENQMVRAVVAAEQGDPARLQAIELLAPNWGAYAVVILIAGAIAAGIYYVFGAWWYNVRIGWCEGRKDPEDAKFLYLYTSALPALCTVIATVLAAMKYDTPLDTIGGELTVGDGLLIGIVTAATVWSYYVSFRGVHVVTGARPGRALFWFCLLPLGILALAVVSVVAAMLALAAEG